ncbi:MAG: SoxR reducing system RseC family protein [Gammaproteobacteria bacterium]|nr:SoxR reducing system RseC family protein [Gammaproteobacteria bacterium]
MIKQQAKVIKCDDSTVWLEAERQSTCSACKLKQGCGTGLLENHVGKRFSQIAVKRTGDVNLGQTVNVAIPEEALLHGALLMYMLPLFLLFAFSAFAQLLQLNEVVEIIAGISGLLLGFYLVRTRLKNKKNGFQARIIED